MNNIPTYILNAFLILIAIYIFILYVKDKNFHEIPCYNMMIISLLLFLDNVLRVIPVGNTDALQVIQAFILVFFDKFLLNTLTVQAILFYFGVILNKKYEKNKKAIFITSFSISFIISIILATTYIIIGGRTSYGIYWYCGDNSVKKIIDPIFVGILIAINSYCILILLGYLYNKINKVSKGEIEDLDYCHNFTRVLLMFFVNMLTFIEQYLIIFDVFDFNEVNVDFIYLSTCLIIDLYYTLNKTIYDETCFIFCNKPIKKPKKMDDEEEEIMQRSESWSIEMN